MKKIFILLFTSASLFAFAQGNKSVEYWPNNQKKAEGEYNKPLPDTKNMTKQERLAALQGIFKVGKWTYWHQNGQLAGEQEFSNGIPTGHWKSWYDNGKQETDYDFATGKATLWHQNGQKNSEGNILTTFQYDGKWVGWHDNGKINYEGAYKAGQKDGIWKFYDTTGNLYATESWNNGKKAE